MYWYRSPTSRLKSPFPCPEPGFPNEPQRICADNGVPREPHVIRAVSEGTGGSVGGETLPAASEGSVTCPQPCELADEFSTLSIMSSGFKCNSKCTKDQGTGRVLTLLYGFCLQVLSTSLMRLWLGTQRRACAERTGHISWTDVYGCVYLLTYASSHVFFKVYDDSNLSS